MERKQLIEKETLKELDIDGWILSRMSEVIPDLLDRQSIKKFMLISSPRRRFDESKYVQVLLGLNDNPDSYAIVKSTQTDKFFKYQLASDNRISRMVFYERETSIENNSLDMVRLAFNPFKYEFDYGGLFEYLSEITDENGIVIVPTNLSVMPKQVQSLIPGPMRKPKKADVKTINNFYLIKHIYVDRALAKYDMLILSKNKAFRDPNENPLLYDGTQDF